MHSSSLHDYSIGPPSQHQSPSHLQQQQRWGDSPSLNQPRAASFLFDPEQVAKARTPSAPPQQVVEIASIRVESGDGPMRYGEDATVAAADDAPPPPPSWPRPAEAENGVKTCRICLMDDEAVNAVARASDPIIRPCDCRTVHRSCLNQWRSAHQGGSNFTRCEICLAEYQLSDAPQAASVRWNSARLYFRWALDILAVVALIEAGSALCALFLYGVDQRSEVIAGLLSHSNKMGVYFLLGHGLFFFVIGLGVLFYLCLAGSSGRRGYMGNSPVICWGGDCGGGCGDCNCGDCGGSSGEGAAIVLLVVVAVVVVVGWCAVLFMAFHFLSKSFVERVQLVKRQESARVQIVKDLDEGRVQV